MNAGVDLTQPLLDVSAISDMKAAKTQGQLSAIQLQQAVVDLKVNVARAYYLVLLNQERLGKAEKSVQRFQKASEDAKVFIVTGEGCGGPLPAGLHTSWGHP